MYKKNSCIIYKREVCKIVEIKKKYINDIDYYILTPISDDSLTINVPVDNKLIRNLITKKDVDNIIKNIPDIEVIDADTRALENYYKKLITSGNHLDLVKIIKTTYLRNKERIDNNKKTTDQDNYYFSLAESYLYNEFSIVLGLSYEDTKNYVTNRVLNHE